MRAKKQRFSRGHWIVFTGIFTCAQIIGQAIDGKLTLHRAGISLAVCTLGGFLMALSRPYWEPLDAKIKGLFSRRRASH